MSTASQPGGRRLGACPLDRAAGRRRARRGGRTARDRGDRRPVLPGGSTASATPRGWPRLSWPAKPERALRRSARRTGDRVDGSRDGISIASARTSAAAGLGPQRAASDRPARRGRHRRFLATLGLNTLARLLAGCEPYRVRWALQHLPYPIAKRIRSLMPSTSQGDWRTTILSLEAAVLEGRPWHRLDLERGMPGRIPMRAPEDRASRAEPGPDARPARTRPRAAIGSGRGCPGCPARQVRLEKRLAGWTEPAASWLDWLGRQIEPADRAGPSGDRLARIGLRRPGLIAQFRWPGLQHAAGAGRGSPPGSCRRRPPAGLRSPAR